MQSDPAKAPVAASQRAHDLPRSGIRKIFNAARELQESGQDVIRLDIGDPDFDLPERITAATHEAMRAGFTHYSPMAGLNEARAAIAAHMQRRFGMPGSDEERFGGIVLNQGATQGLNSAMQLACDSGDSILLPEIYWPNYIQQVTLAGIRPRFYRLTDTYQPVLEDLERLADETTRAVLINSPGNPTGALFPPETVRAIYDFAVNRDLWLISDEAYCDFVYDGEHVTPLQFDWALPPEQRRVLGVFSFSKSYAATGLRLGWSVIPRPDITLILATMNEPLTGSLTTPLQFGMVAGLAEEDASQRRDGLVSRKELAYELLVESGLPVEKTRGGLFYFVNIGATGMSAEEFAFTLLHERLVSVVPGDSFGLQPTYHADGHMSFAPCEKAARSVRLCFAVDEDKLREGVKRLAEFVKDRL